MKWCKRMIYFCRIIFIVNSIYDVCTLRIGEAAFLLGSLLLTFVPELFTKLTKVKIPVGASLIYTLFLLCSQWLGSYLDFYVIFPWWDVFLHSLSGVFIGYVALIILVALDPNRTVFKHNLAGLIFTFIFAIGVTGAGLWEIIEFLGDFFLGTTSQHNSLKDTMEDIICGTVGGLAFGAYIGIMLSHKKKCCVDTLLRLNGEKRKRK